MKQKRERQENKFVLSPTITELYTPQKSCFTFTCAFLSPWTELLTLLALLEVKRKSLNANVGWWPRMDEFWMWTKQSKCPTWMWMGLVGLLSNYRCSSLWSEIMDISCVVELISPSLTVKMDKAYFWISLCGSKCHKDDVHVVIFVQEYDSCWRYIVPDWAASNTNYNRQCL